MNYVRSLLNKIGVNGIKFIKFSTPYLLRWGLTATMSACVVFLMTYQKPKSLNMLFLVFAAGFCLKIIFTESTALAVLKNKVFSYLNPRNFSTDPRYRFSYAEYLMLSAFACDVCFEKKFAILGCIFAIFSFIAIDILKNILSKEDLFLINEKMFVKFIFVFIAFILAFILSDLNYKHKFSAIAIVFASVLLTIGQILSFKIKKFGQPAIISIASSALLTFINVFVITE